jgi:hypothetical protein
MTAGIMVQTLSTNIWGQLEMKESKKNICARCETLFQAILNWWHCPLDAENSKAEMSCCGCPFKIVRMFLKIIFKK